MSTLVIKQRSAFHGQRPRTISNDVLTGPQKNEVHVWLRSAAVADPAVDAECLALLSPDEAARHDRFQIEADRRMFRIAHGFLRTLLSRYAPVTPRAWR